MSNTKHTAIECKVQKLAEKWFSFTDDEISEMDDGDLEWWNNWKDIIKAINTQALEVG